eukprot:638866_1
MNDSKRKLILEHWMRSSLRIDIGWTNLLPIIVAYSRNGLDPEDMLDLITRIPLCELTDTWVYKAFDKQNGEQVAIKVVPTALMNPTNHKFAQHQLELLKSYQSQYIVACKGAYFRDDDTWIVMEYCSAGDVLTSMKLTKQCFNEELIQIVMREALQGLQYLHSQNVIHGLLQGRKIFMNQSGHCKLSLPLVTFDTRHNASLLGAPYWEAPEGMHGTKSDIWRLGITAIEMATGKPPHANKTPLQFIFRILVAPPPTLPHNQDWSNDFRDFVRLCLIKDPSQRPTAEELLKHDLIKNAKDTSVVHEWLRKRQPLVDSYVDKLREEQGKEIQMMLVN